jgi:acyl-CoA thioester hydrolase
MTAIKGSKLNDEYPLQAEAVVKVPFQDADPAGVAWHGNYFRYFDTARCALLEQINYSYAEMAESGFMWPIVDTRVKFIQPVYFDQEILVKAILDEWEYRLRISYEVFVEGKRVTRGYTVQVAVAVATGELQLGSPSVLIDRLNAWVAGRS